MPASNAQTFCYSDLTVGQTAEFAVSLTEKVITQFAALSGDHSPLHMDEAYAETTPFKGRIAQGMLGASFFSRLVGMHLPGKYALYLSQQLMFKQPVRAGMNLTVRGEVVQKTDAAQVVKIKTQIIDAASGSCLIDGEAMVKLLA